MPLPSGPLSVTVNIPPRPKPGRKPVKDENHADKRRQQNRQAQRNFRDKRSQQLAEAKEELARERAEHLKAQGEFQNKIQALRDEIAALEASNASLQASLQARDDQISRLAQTGVRDSAVDVTTAFATHSSDSYTTPPHSEEADYQELETDWTAKFARPKPMAEESLSGPMDVDGGCGFCSDDSNCVCKAALKPAGCGLCSDGDGCACKSPEVRSTRSVPVTRRKVPKMQPGSCDACQADPKRAQACRDLASQTAVGPFRPATLYEQPDPSKVTALPPSSSMLSPAERRITCSSFIDQINQRHAQRSNLPPISEILAGPQPIHRYPAVSGTGYELPEKEAAEALSNLYRRDTMQSADAMRTD